MDDYAALLEKQRKLMDSLQNLDDESDDEPSTKRSRVGGEGEEFVSPASPFPEHDTPDSGYGDIIENDNDDRNEPLVCPARPVIGPRTPSASPPASDSEVHDERKEHPIGPLGSVAASRTVRVAAPYLSSTPPTSNGLPCSAGLVSPMASSRLSPNITGMGNGGTALDSREPTDISRSAAEAENGVAGDDHDVGVDNTQSQNIIDPTNDKAPTDMIERSVLDSYGSAHFEPLPDDWIQVTHASGFFIYKHHPSRVITWSRPYMIGKTDSLRHHELPLSAIPCLHQKKINERKATLEESGARAEERKKKESEGRQEIVYKELDGNGADVGELPVATPDVPVEKIENNLVGAQELNNYIKLRFDFKTVLLNRNKCDAKFNNNLRNRQGQLAAADGGTLSSQASKGVKLPLIRIPTPDNRLNRREFVLNPTGQSSLAILHKYAQNVLKGRVVYDLHTSRNVALPFTVTAIIMVKKSIREKLDPTIREKLALFQEKMKLSRPVNYAIGMGPRDDEDPIVVGRVEAASAKAGKKLVCCDVLKVLIPDLNFNHECVALLGGSEMKENYEEKAIELFSAMAIDDHRIFDLCSKTGQPIPLVLLREACNRSIALDGALPEVACVKGQGGQEYEATVTVGHLRVTVSAGGFKLAKQLAAQAMLKEMHPTLTNYGQFLQLFGESKAQRKVNKKNHDEVVSLNNQGSHVLPNMALIAKLKEEMARVAQQLTSNMPIRAPVPTSYPPV